MKSLSPWHTNAAVCASAFIKPAEIRQSSPRTDLDENTAKRFPCEAIAITIIFQKQEHMTQPTKKLSASDSEEHMLGHGFYNKHSHEQAKANTYGLPLIVEAISRIDLAQIGAGTKFAFANENCDRPDQNARCQSRRNDDSNFRYAHRFADKRLEHTLSNGSLFARQLSGRREQRVLFRERYLHLSADLSAEPHRIRLFGDHGTLAQQEAVQYPKRNLVGTRDRAGARDLGSTSESRLARVFTIPRAGNATISSAHHCWQRSGRGR